MTLLDAIAINAELRMEMMLLELGRNPAEMPQEEKDLLMAGIYIGIAASMDYGTEE